MDKHTVSLQDQNQQAPCEERKGQGKPALTQVLMLAPCRLCVEETLADNDFPGLLSVGTAEGWRSRTGQSTSTSLAEEALSPGFHPKSKW